jgi:hypothetical protein
MIRIEGPREPKTASPKTVERSGYLEEEYLVSGTADLYGYDDSWQTVLTRPDVRFITRLLVRRPGDDSLATGDVLLEPLHPAGDMASTWPRLGNALLKGGWSWVGVTQHPMGLAATVASDPEQYGDLDISDPGLGYDIVAQVATWLRADGLPGLHLDHLFMSGASHTGTFERVFLGDGFHERARRPDGGPAVEGYLIQISSGAFMMGGYHPLSGDCPPPPAGDRRRVIQPFDVPVIELLSEGEAETNRDSRRPDSDEPGDRFRLYEVPGACHMTSRDPVSRGLPETVEEPSDFPMPALAGGALRNLRRWAVEGIAPPRAARLTNLSSKDDGPCGRMAEALPLLRDEHGNAVGGVRTPELDIPIATYYPHSTLRSSDSDRSAFGGDIMGSMTRFSTEKLKALYGSPEDYRAQYEAEVARLVTEGWINEDEAEEWSQRASKVTF